MKHLFALLLASMSVCMLQAQQNVGIGTNSPAPSAQLDVTSINKGFLMPRMTSLQRTSIGSPAPGLLVYETTTNTIYVYNGTSWLQLASGGVSPWVVSGNNIYNSNTANVGIGNTAPTFKLHVSGTTLIENGLLEISDNIPTVKLRDGSTLLAYMKTGSGSTNDLRIGTYVTSNPDGRILFEIEQSAKMTIDHSGEVGIGTISPAHKLDVRGDIYAQGDVLIEDGFMQILNTTNSTNWIVSNSAALGGRMLFLNGGMERVIFRNDGNVGIGGDLPLTSNGFPNTKLHIESGQDAGLSSSNNGYLMLGPSSGTNMVIDNNEIVARDGFTGTATLFLQNNGGALSIGAPTTINSDAEALKINGTGPYMTFNTGGVFEALIGVLNNDLRMDAGNGNISAVAQNIKLLPSGQVSIGVSVAAASGYKLTVDGKVLCEELKVKLRSSGWPDYVFAKNYNLPSLSELEKYIQDNKHLPNIPSAAEVDANGIEVGDMQKRMMEKIEELTLYIIQLQKQVDELKKTTKHE